MAAGAVEQVGDLREPEDVLHDPAVKRELELAVGGRGGDVQEGAGGRGHRQAAVDPDIAGLEDAAAVRADAGVARGGCVVGGDLDDAGRWSPQAPQGRRGPVAERGALADKQQRVGLPAKLDRSVVAHEKHASKGGEQAMPRHQPRDGGMAHADRQQLSSGDPAPLPGGHGGDPLIP
jgi:hypothetical protein